MCITTYQTYSNCDCFLVKITYCQLSSQLLETRCPELKERIMESPFKCGSVDCPRLETCLWFEGQAEDVRDGEERRLISGT
jgi:hypothetical protein